MKTLFILLLLVSGCSTTSSEPVATPKCVDDMAERECTKAACPDLSTCHVYVECSEEQDHI